jgi:hypothetical protein
MRSVRWHAASKIDFYRTCGSDPVEHRRFLAIRLDHPHLLTRLPVMFTALTVDSEAGARVGESEGQREAAVGDLQAVGQSVVAGINQAARRAVAAGVIVVVAVGGLAGWLGYCALQGHRAATERGMFVQMARQGATGLDDD